jgi:hypothetical protein
MKYKVGDLITEGSGQKKIIGYIADISDETIKVVYLSGEYIYRLFGVSSFPRALKKLRYKHIPVKE